MTASMTDRDAPDPGAGWVPVDTCTLPTAQRPLRVAEFDELFASALRTVESSAPSAPRARLVLAGDDMLVGRVQQLADAETCCCSFFTFTVTSLDLADAGVPGETLVALDIEVPTARADVLDALVQRAAARRPTA
jgi:hypothetical protein